MVKGIIKNIVNANEFLKKRYNKKTNQYTKGTKLIKCDNIHLKNNRINISDQNSSVILGDGSFLQGCGILFRGGNNRILVEDGTEIYGSNGNHFHINGHNNTIVIGSGGIIRETSFFISGDNNMIKVGAGCSIMLGQFHVEGNSNRIQLGEGVTIHGRDSGAVHMAVDEGSKIVIGNDCMFSNDIQIRSSDSHSILDMNGKRINPAEDIHIGQHVWIGMRATILKGCKISDYCIVAAGSICTREYNESNCIIGGNPAKVIKHEVDWDRKYIV